MLGSLRGDDRDAGGKVPQYLTECSSIERSNTVHSARVVRLAAEDRVSLLLETAVSECHLTGQEGVQDAAEAENQFIVLIPREVLHAFSFHRVAQALGITLQHYHLLEFSVVRAVLVER